MNPLTMARIAINRLRFGRGIAAPRRPSADRLRFFGQFVGQGSLVYDVGANVGDMSAVFVALGARVIAFEPQPTCTRILRRRFSGQHAIEIVEAGLADSPGQLMMHVCASAKTISTFSEEWQSGRFRDTFRWDEQIAVPVMTLDEALARFGTPDYMKIDVEGFEERVLGGLSSKVGPISFEFVKEFAEKTERCLRALEALGYSEFNLTLGEEYAFVADEWTDAAAVLARIDGSDDPLLQGDIYAR